MIKLPKINPASRVGILGGSFDPPHLGHQILAVCALALEEIDEIWVLPCADHPFAKKLSSFSHRMKMCELAFAMLDSRVKIVGVEKDLPAPSYSVQTLEAIHAADQTIQLSLIMGSDVYLDLSKWKNPERLAELSNIIVFLREGSPLQELSKVSIPAKIHDQFVLPHIKSTVIREMLQQRNLEQSFIDRNVLEYAMQHELY